MTDTPRTDAEAKFEIECAQSFVTCVPASFARELERDLAAEKAKHEAAASFAVGMDHDNAGLIADLEDAREQLAAAQKDTSNTTDTLKLCNKIESYLNSTISPAVIIGRDHMRDLIAAARSGSNAVALLRKWRDTELDPMNEEFDQWIQMFTKMVCDVLKETP